MKNNKKTQGYADKGMPLYDHSSFLYYFENRLKMLVSEEVKSQFNQAFYGLPF